LEDAVEEVCLPGYGLLLAEVTGLQLGPIEPEGFDIRVHIASEKAGLDSREKRTAAAILQSGASKAVRSDVRIGRRRSNPVVDEISSASAVLWSSVGALQSGGEVPSSRGEERHEFETRKTARRGLLTER
jgi:hypothetical protein